MKRFLWILAILGSSACSACQTPPTTPNPPDAGDCAAACANVKAVAPECPEGQSSACTNVCANNLAPPGMPHPNTACLKAAKNASDVRACGWVCTVGK